jgi:hypothetical protein
MRESDRKMPANQKKKFNWKKKFGEKKKRSNVENEEMEKLNTRLQELKAVS